MLYWAKLVTHKYKAKLPPGFTKLGDFARQFEYIFSPSLNSILHIDVRVAVVQIGRLHKARA